MGDVATGASNAPVFNCVTQLRRWSSSPRVQGRRGRDLGRSPRQTTLWKMTGLTARNIGVAGRGPVAVGQAVGLLIVGDAVVHAHAACAPPQRPSAGMETAPDNGEVMWQKRSESGARPSRMRRCRPRSGAPRLAA